MDNLELKTESADLQTEILRLQTLSDEHGHVATLREILQQPATWLITAKQASALLVDLKHFTDGVAAVILTGSGSSEYAGDCSRPMLQRRLGITVQVTGSGTILTDGIDLLAPERPALMISFARSGDSPESVAALLKVSEADSAVRQLVITCNANGQLAAKAKMDANVHAVVLDDRTNDRSLVMTSSFTNMVLTAMSLGWSANPSGFVSFAEQLSQTAERLLDDAFQRLPKIARLPFHRAFYLADASAFGAARESALKMTEMTAGRVMTTSETYLGLRHGPMSAIDPNTLVVCFLSSEPVRRAYEIDLISELNAKKLGLRKILVGANIPQDLLNDGDLAFEDNGFVAAGDDGCSLLHVLIGQVLAFYRCMHEGLKPDAPSATGVISRVVQKFRLHGISTAG